jgi:uncharacterized protein YycO
MENLQLFFSNTRSIASYTVRFATWGEFGHVGIYQDGMIIEANSTIGKVVHRPFCPEEYSKYIIRTYDVPGELIWSLASQQVGKPYDWSAIYGFAFRRNWQSEDKWFCSELVEWCALKSGYSLVNKASWRVTPQDLNEVVPINSRKNIIANS